jgi:hypothetical protein
MTVTAGLNSARLARVAGAELGLDDEVHASNAMPLYGP